MNNHKLLQGLYVSCQPATGDEPFYDYDFIKRFAFAAEFGGAKAVRIEGIENVRNLLPIINLPIISLIKKQKCNNLDMRNITATYDDILQLYEIGARIVAIDFTFREGCDDFFYSKLMKKVRREMPDIEIYADVSTIEEAIMSEMVGVDYISSTLAGYTEKSKHQRVPNFEIIEEMSKRIKIPYIAEGGISSEYHIKRIIELKCYGVVIGTAITRPHVLTANLVKALEEKSETNKNRK
ncbi:MAG: putative N-acetylmannosamine-6-phosphate 2-epimerase [Saprospiraceae bacterium]|nr:putative N-acetylmannosamine-6-phosphate 2-epimerase [Saprospiraceae bacterium]